MKKQSSTDFPVHRQWNQIDSIEIDRLIPNAEIALDDWNKTWPMCHLTPTQKQSTIFFQQHFSFFPEIDPTAQKPDNGLTFENFWKFDFTQSRVLIRDSFQPNKLVGHNWKYLEVKAAHQAQVENQFHLLSTLVLLGYGRKQTNITFSPFPSTHTHTHPHCQSSKLKSIKRKHTMPWKLRKSDA